MFMESLIQVKKLKYIKNDNLILNNVTFNVNHGDFISLLGTNGSGKSSLLKLLYKHNLKNIKVCNDITVDYVTSSFTFSSDTVYELLLNEDINKCDIDKLAKVFGVSDILKCRPSTLSYGMQCLVHLMEVLIQPSDLLLLDNILDGIDLELRKKVFKYLKKITSKKNITVIYATNHSDDILYFSKLMLLNQGHLVYFGKMEDSLLDDELWKSCFIPYPFEIELSKKLKYYGLLDKNVLSIDKLVKMLWK